MGGLSTAYDIGDGAICTNNVMGYANSVLYLGDAYKIAKACRLEYGRAPSLERIQGLLDAKRGKRDERRASYLDGKDYTPANDDGSAWAPAGLVKPEPEPAPRQRDYIDIRTAPKERRPLYGAELIKSVADDFGISYGELIGEARERYFVEARAVVCRVLRDRGWSFPKIGNLLGKRDHSSICNAINKFDIYAKRNPLVSESYERHRPEVATDAA